MGERSGTLPPAHVAELASRGFTRRGILKIAALASAGAGFPFVSERALAQLSDLGRSLPADAVKINANEFPEGPSERALAALLEVARRGNRYQYAETSDLVKAAAALEELQPEHFEVYPGSSLALQHAVMAFTSPERGLVTVDPGYEAAVEAAKFIGAPVARVPLRPDGAHDTKRMLEVAHATRASLLYVCNPNNPTGTVTPRSEIEALIESKPAGSVVLLDEAYIHFCDEPPGTDLVRAGKDVVLLRTFSKIYGMAGLRAGFAMGRRDLLTRAAAYKSGAMPASAMAAAHAMLGEPALVAARKQGNAERRARVMRFFDSHGFAYTPSVSNKLMVDARMPTKQVIDGLAKHDVFVGRPWPVWPTHVRVSIGSQRDMERFEKAFLAVTAGGPTAA